LRGSFITTKKRHQGREINDYRRECFYSACDLYRFIDNLFGGVSIPPNQYSDFTTFDEWQYNINWNTVNKRIDKSCNPEYYSALTKSIKEYKIRKRYKIVSLDNLN
jgi:hypothetical protein